MTDTGLSIINVLILYTQYIFIIYYITKYNTILKNGIKMELKSIN